jgi:hypothetical protein
MVDVSAKGAPVYAKFQFERLGYFCVDKDSTKDKVTTFIYGVCINLVHPIKSM